MCVYGHIYVCMYNKLIVEIDLFMISIQLFPNSSKPEHLLMNPINSLCLEIHRLIIITVTAITTVPEASDSVILYRDEVDLTL